MKFFLQKNFIIFQVLIVLFLFLLQPAFAAKEQRYTKVNIHTQMKESGVSNASYANYTNPGAGHVIIPAGTQIVITRKSRKKFIFTYADGKRVNFEFHQPRMGMSIDEYLDKISSPEPVSFSGLSKKDKQGVAEGKALVGMSRKGVMTALGYPAAHKTPSLESSTWIYWGNRFRTVGVDFDDKGKVVKVR